MKRWLVDHLRCPACHGSLRLGDASALAGPDIILAADLTCTCCGRVYTVRDGAPYLAVADGAWRTILKELINRREIIADNLSRPRPADQAARKVVQDRAARSLAESCFDEITRHLPAGAPLRILDCGAGMFETSAWFADRGHEVVATDTEISMIRHANFLGPAHGDPQPFAINGHTCHIRNPVPFAHYFTRVAADIQRLPFADATFDVAFCRAMLHHVDNVAGALGEMARVVRPGGLLLVCAEPYRSVLDREADFQEDAVDREEGMNEQAPTIRAYRRPLARYAADIAIQYWPSTQLFRAGRLFRALGIDPMRWLHPGQTVRDWRWRKLWLTAGAANIVARRNVRPAFPPRPFSGSGPAPITPIVDVYFDDERHKSLDALRAGTEALKALRRQLLAADPSAFPFAIEPGRTKGMVLESGWGPIAHHDGRPHRAIGHRAAVVLRRPGGARALEIIAAVPPGTPPTPVTVRVNGAPVGTVTPPPNGWATMVLPLVDDPLPIAQLEFQAAAAPALAVAAVRFRLQA
jgi:SAM-dependent methyltransferase/uncharacterized protein YbaR (Trm112 family)